MSTEPEPAPIEPFHWYEVTAQDITPTCVNLGEQFYLNPCWSNGGGDDPACFSVGCGLCSQRMAIVSYTLLDPQPDVG